MRSWQILTGEYPPQPGGIADYTGRLVESLKARGEDVHVWAPGQTLSRGFGFSGLRSIAQGLAAARAAGREPIVLVQYAPNAFGMRGANLLLCAWLLLRARWHGDDVRVMFHEPFFYFARQSLGRNALALVHRIMAALLLMASRISYVSTGSWEGLLSQYAGSRRTFVRLPIPATVTPRDNPAAVARIRESMSGPDAFVVGHFGTYPDDIARELQPVVAGVLGALENATVLLIGRKGDDLRRRFIAAFPQYESRIVATGELTSDRLADHLRACDVLVQPYPDGATTRRTSLMAALACGVPTVTTVGRWSEPLWRSAGDAVELAPAGDAIAVVDRCRYLANDPARRQVLRAAAPQFYERHFSMDRTLRVLLGARSGDPQVLVGVNVHPAQCETERRQRRALAALAALDNVRRVNLQFESPDVAVAEAEGFETLRVLARDSTSVTRQPGARKPIATDVFDTLARRALDEGCPYFAYLNSDTAFSQDVVDRIGRGDADAYFIARTDVGGDRLPEILIAGVDAFAVNAAWWIANSRRFRPYILGEPVWDTVYAAQLACHGRAAFVHEIGALTHERHERQWTGSPFAAYVRYLSALDAPYFSLWCRFHDRLASEIEAGRGYGRAAAIAADTFVWRPSPAARAVQASRRLKWWVRYLAEAT